MLPLIHRPPGRSLALTYPEYVPFTRCPQGLVRQNQQLGTPFVVSVDAADLERHYDVVVDAVFGFSFKSGGIRAPFDILLAALRTTKVPVAAIDIPSGWDVERGDVDHIGVRPAALISLTAPKLCARYLDPSVRHILAGRFVPPYAACAHFPGVGSFVQAHGRRLLWGAVTYESGRRPRRTSSTFRRTRDRSSLSG